MSYETLIAIGAGTVGYIIAKMNTEYKILEAKREIKNELAAALDMMQRIPVVMPQQNMQDAQNNIPQEQQLPKQAPTYVG